MPQEIEIKLTVGADHLAEVERWLAPRLSGGAAKPAGECPLLNRYFDTPDGQLNRARAALRVRQSGDRWIQTLKTQGEYRNGAHRREEWEWPVSGPALDLSVLAGLPLADAVDLGQLDVVFETNFRRRIWNLTESVAEVEMALDSGLVLAGGRESPLNEVEFELKSGDPDVLHHLAGELAGSVPVLLNLVSKAEQGYHLAGIGAVARPERQRSGEALSVARWLDYLSQCWLLGALVALPTDRLAALSSAADRAGVSDVWSELAPLLAAGLSVPALLDAFPRLGQVQLALARS
ncbi:CYTH domain-containing protein [Marinobacter sp. C2H3]|uniref:CYTH domain-containing protein n=1 Tax=Marinobacter sp. C2H3 TaxID=3119003 RepID=UPI00300EE1AA